MSRAPRVEDAFSGRSSAMRQPAFGIAPGEAHMALVDRGTTSRRSAVLPMTHYVDFLRQQWCALLFSRHLPLELTRPSSLILRSCSVELSAFDWRDGGASRTPRPPPSTFHLAADRCRLRLTARRAHARRWVGRSVSYLVWLCDDCRLGRCYRVGALRATSGVRRGRRRNASDARLRRRRSPRRRSRIAPSSNVRNESKPLTQMVSARASSCCRSLALCPTLQSPCAGE